MKKRIIVCAVAAILLLSTLCGCMGTAAGDTFDYMKSDLAGYLDSSLLKYKGVTFNFKGAEDELSNYTVAYMDANWDSILWQLRVLHREGDANAVNKSGPIGEGDDLYMYVISVKWLNDEGEYVDVHLDQSKQKVTVDGVEKEINVGGLEMTLFEYVNYASLEGPFVVGNGEAFGKTFDEAIKGMIPADTYLKQDTMSELKADDVVYLHWSRIDKASTSAKHSYEQNRVDLSTWDPAVSAKLAEVFNEKKCPYGEEITFDVTVNEPVAGGAEGETKEVTYEYKATVGFICDEKKTSVDFKVDEDCFIVPEDKEASNYDFLYNLAKLNNKNLRVEFIISHTIDYTLPEVDAAFFKETLEYETEETELPKIIEGYKAHAVEEMNQNERNSLNDAVKVQIWQNLYSTENLLLSYPSNMIELEMGLAAQTLYESFNETAGNPSSQYYSYYQYGLYGYEYYQEAADAYCSAVYGYSSSEYIENLAYGNVAQKLVMYYIYRNEPSLKIADSEIDKAYNEYIDKLIEDAEENREEDDETVYDKAYFEKNFADIYGEDYLRSYIAEDLIYEKVTNFLVESNTIDTSPTTAVTK